MSEVQILSPRPFPNGTKRISPYYRVIRTPRKPQVVWFSFRLSGVLHRIHLRRERYKISPRSSATPEILSQVCCSTYKIRFALVLQGFVKSDAPENVCCRTLSQRAVCKAEFYDVRKTSFPIESIILTATVRINARKERERRLVC